MVCVPVEGPLGCVSELWEFGAVTGSDNTSCAYPETWLASHRMWGWVRDVLLGWLAASIVIAALNLTVGLSPPVESLGLVAVWLGTTFWLRQSFR